MSKCLLIRSKEISLQFPIPKSIIIHNLFKKRAVIMSLKYKSSGPQLTRVSFISLFSILRYCTSFTVNFNTRKANFLDSEIVVWNFADSVYILMTCFYQFSFHVHHLQGSHILVSSIWFIILHFNVIFSNQSPWKWSQERVKHVGTCRLLILF